MAIENDQIDGKDMWADRIQKIPDFFIEGIVDEATSVGLPASKKSDCIDFLKKRRSDVGAIIKSNIQAFPKLPKGTAAL